MLTITCIAKYCDTCLYCQTNGRQTLGCVFIAFNYRSCVQPLAILLMARYLLQNWNEREGTLGLVILVIPDAHEPGVSNPREIELMYSRDASSKNYQNTSDMLSHKHNVPVQPSVSIYNSLIQYKKTQQRLLKNTNSSSKTECTEYVVNKLLMLYWIN